MSHYVDLPFLQEDEDPCQSQFDDDDAGECYSTKLVVFASCKRHREPMNVNPREVQKQR